MNDSKEKPIIIPLRDKQAVIEANSKLLTGLSAFTIRFKGPYEAFTVMPGVYGIRQLTETFPIVQTPNETISKLICDLLNEIFYHQFPASRPILDDGGGLLT